MTTTPMHAASCGCAICAAPVPREGSIPFDGLDVAGMPANLAQAERRAILGLLPRKSMWPELKEHDQRVTELQARQTDTEARLHDLRERRLNAPDADAQAAAAWEMDGRKGSRPESTVERLDAKIADAERERDGVAAAVDHALEQRGRFMEKNGDRLAGVAGQQGDVVLKELLDLFDQIVQKRGELDELRAAETWARLFPHEQATREPMTRLLGGGLKHVMEPLGLNVQIDYAKVIETLTADAKWVRNAAASNEQRALLEGRDPRRPSGSAWADSDEARAERKAELEAAVAAFRAEWGFHPSESQLVAFMGERVRRDA